MTSEMDYLADDLEGEAPCEFCGELFPLILLIEHQTTHLTGGDDYGYLDEILNQEEVQNVISESIEGVTASPEEIVEQNLQSAVKNEPQVIVDQKQQSAVSQENTNEKSADSVQNLSSKINDKIELMPAYKRRRIVSSSSSESDQNFHMDEQNDVKSEDDEISILFEAEESAKNITMQQKQSAIFSKTLKDIKKFPEQKKNETITEKGEKLLVLGDEIDPDKEMENEKPAYKMPNNPLLNIVHKKDDVIDINDLSDDDCDESLEEFWKRARDKIKIKK